MNQHSLLKCIRRLVRENITDDGDARPLGEIVGKVMKEINGAAPQPVASDRKIVPVAWVAAMVDGGLSDSEADAVCQAALSDRSIVAELVAAVRAQYEAEPTSGQASQSLPPSLSDRILQMSAALAPDTVAPDTVASLDTVAPLAEATEPVEPIASGTIHAPPSPAAPSPRGAWPWIGGVAVVAATVLAVVYLRSRPVTNPPPTERAVVENRERHSATEPGAESIPPLDSGSSPMIVDAPKSVAAPKDAPTSTSPPDQPPIHREISDDASMFADQSLPAATQPASPSAKHRSPMLVPDVATPSVNRPSATALGGLKWKRIQGILAEAQAITPPATAAATPRTAVTWNSIGEDVISLGADTGTHDIRLRTLSYSRAEAELATGGRLVLRSESGAEIRSAIDASVEIDLQHGGIAFIDFPVDTILNLRSLNRDVGRIHWSQPKSTVLAEFGQAGLLIHVQGAGVTIDDRAAEETTMVIASDHEVHSVAALKRLPTWVTRPVKSAGIPRTILAQFSGSSDLMRTMNQRIGDLAGKSRLTPDEQKTLAILARWQVTLGELNLFRMISNQLPVVRLVALERLVDMPEWEPRYESVWEAIQRASNDRNHAVRIQRLCLMVRTGRKPTRQQVDQMITALDSPALATRAMYDYLLRRMFGGGPNFDPTIANANRRRVAISGWRNYIARRN